MIALLVGSIKGEGKFEGLRVWSGVVCCERDILFDHMGWSLQEKLYYYTLSNYLSDDLLRLSEIAVSSSSGT